MKNGLTVLVLIACLACQRRSDATAETKAAIPVTGQTASTSAAATDLSACLADKGVDPHGIPVTAGYYRVSIDTSSYSKDALVALLGSFSDLTYRSVHPKTFPTLYGSVLSFQAVPAGLASTETFADVRKRVVGDIAKISALPGLSVTCPADANTNPVMGVSN